jgi:hypothetical protein
MTAAVAPQPSRLLHSRWYPSGQPMRSHPVQAAYYQSRHRFNVVPAGRRSGKTEIAKRRLVKRAVRGSDFDRPRYFAAAPTWDQAKRIFWADLKRMVPKEAMRGRPSESDLIIPLWHGGEIFLFGMDKPERAEGAPIDGGVLDEYANMKEKAWGENLSPALAEREGWCDFIGVPEGRNHYYVTDKAAQAELLEKGDASEWGRFHWKSADILPAKEIESQRRRLDPLTFEQEFEASFVTFAGRAYYTFTDAHAARLRDRYDPNRPLIICLDFNVEPGVAAVAQEMALPIRQLVNGIPVLTTPQQPHVGTGVIGEVWIDNNSNTPAVCRKLLKDWKDHRGEVHVYGDATGGARGTAQVEGSDWDLAKKTLRGGDASQQLKGFGPRVTFFVKDANPAERARVNAMNSRLCATDGTVRLMVDSAAAPHVVTDLEGVTTLTGGSGEIDKKKNPKLTHISDALGYYVEHRYPIVVRTGGVSTYIIG